MAEIITKAESPLRLFLESAGRSLSDAQRSLGVEAGGAPTMLLSTAELEVKAAVRSDAKGALSLQPMSVSDITRGTVDPGLLSTFRLQFVATAPDVVPTPGPAPKRRVADLVAELRRKTDLGRIEKIVGELSYAASFIPARQVWLVTATDANNQVVREVILSDEVKETRRG
jgi:hypothetical protein